MKDRCTNPNNPRWSDYGGAGITFDPKWADFENFLDDMGERPEGTTLDRFPDKRGNYTKANCRWATPREQQNNIRSNVFLTFNGTTDTVAGWSRRIGLNQVALQFRLRRGWSVERALTTPLQN